jgi:hypothetical protein
MSCAVVMKRKRIFSADIVQMVCRGRGTGSCCPNFGVERVYDTARVTAADMKHRRLYVL